MRLTQETDPGGREGHETDPGGREAHETDPGGGEGQEVSPAGDDEHFQGQVLQLVPATVDLHQLRVAPHQ